MITIDHDRGLANADHRSPGWLKSLAIQAVALARQAVGGRAVLLAGSIGPTGQLLKPLGPLDEADALARQFKRIVGQMCPKKELEQRPSMDEREVRRGSHPSVAGRHQ